MKKNILTFSLWLLLFLSSSFWVYAECDNNSCKIQDAPAPVLEEYLNNISRVIGNIQSALSESERETATTKKVQSSILASMSEVINFSWYFSSFDFYVAIPITNEVPYPVKRDHERINRESERLSRILKKITRAWYAEASITNVCDGVSNCKLSGSARSILTSLIKNNKQITDFYRLSIADRQYVSVNSFILVPNNFTSEMSDHYNKDTLQSCSQCEWWFSDKISESIDKISNINTGWSEGIRKWKDAWAQLTGAWWQSSKTQAEDRVLRDYLGTQWLPGDAAESVTDNLARYNSGGLSTSNPLFNSANYTFTNAKEDIDTFVEWAIENYLDTDQEKIPIVIINKTVDEIRKTQDIENDIKEIYEKQVPFAAVQDTNTQKLIWKILRMHYDLFASIEVLDKTVKIAEKVWNSQWQGQGKCSYR